MRPGASNHDLVIRPLGLGEIVDRAVALTVRHLRPLFLWMLLFQGPAVAISRLQLAGVGEVLASLGDPGAALEAAKGASRTSLQLLVVLFLLQAGATAACAWIVAPSLAGPGFAPPTRLRRAVAIPTAALASLLAFAILPAAGALPGLLLLARAEGAAWFAALALFVGGALLALLFTLLRTLLVPVVAAVEGRPHLQALRRSFALMRSPPGTRFLERPSVRASLVLFATLAIAIAVNVLVGVPRAVAGRLVGAGPALLPGSLPIALEVPLGVVEAAASAVLQPFSLVAVAVLYFDRRARREGLDLLAFAEELEREERP